ncbi:MAG: winged helix-turn-helix domain-containing protein [Candidatus Bathyarchaeia archaeon]
MPFNRRRNSLEIIEDILRASLGGARITEIVYKTNMNFKRTKRYLEFLLENGLISAQTPTSNVKVYKTTEEGKGFLETFPDLKRLLGSLHTTKIRSELKKIAYQR